MPIFQLTVTATKIALAKVRGVWLGLRLAWGGISRTEKTCLVAAALVALAPFLAGCTNYQARNHVPKQHPTRCNVAGLNYKSSDPDLIRGLCAMSRSLGPIKVTSSCRTSRANRGVKNSYHLYRRGCKAADIRIKGKSGRTILAWWFAYMQRTHGHGGGRGRYACRSFVHVDVGPQRSWKWNLCKRRKKA